MAAQAPVPTGPEFQVNSYTTNSQLSPSVAVADNGDFVVVWGSTGSSGSDTSGFSIQGQQFCVGPDTDGDGVCDSADNCTLVENAEQTDADGDGCGNACDGDYDQSGGTVAGDFATFKACFGNTVPAAGGPANDPSCAESDMDSSGSIVSGDFALFKAEFGTAPGPGAACP